VQLVATAHTLTDQVETVLLNIVRGTGLRGLTGIPERRDCPANTSIQPGGDEFVLPRARLLDSRRPSKRGLGLLARRIRNVVVPELKQINSGLDAAIVAWGRSRTRRTDSLTHGGSALEQAEAPINGQLRFLSDDCEMRFSRSHWHTFRGAQEAGDSPCLRGIGTLH